MDEPDPGLPIPIEYFLGGFPVFGDSLQYPPSLVNSYLGLAHAQLDATRWGSMYIFGQQLFAAHYLALEAIDAAAVAKGGLAGQPAGVVSSKSLGGASISYDNNLGTEEGAGFWNRTLYGRQLWRWIRMAGMGGVQIFGGGMPLPGPYGYGRGRWGAGGM